MSILVSPWKSFRLALRAGLGKAAMSEPRFLLQVHRDLSEPSRNMPFEHTSNICPSQSAATCVCRMCLTKRQGVGSIISTPYNSTMYLGRYSTSPLNNTSAFWTFFFPFLVDGLRFRTQPKGSHSVLLASLTKHNIRFASLLPQIK